MFTFMSDHETAIWYNKGKHFDLKRPLSQWTLNVFMFVQLRREKVELENALEQEQESLVNRLWKRMDKLETEKRLAFIKIINNNAKQERYSKKCVVDQNNFSGILLGSMSINYFCSKTAFYPLEKITICWFFFNAFLFFYLLGLWSDC